MGSDWYDAWNWTDSRFIGSGTALASSHPTKTELANPTTSRIVTVIPSQVTHSTNSKKLRNTAGKSICQISGILLGVTMLVVALL